MQDDRDQRERFETDEAPEKEFRLWTLLAWLTGVILTLMAIAAIVNVAVLGF